MRCSFYCYLGLEASSLLAGYLTSRYLRLWAYLPRTGVLDPFHLLLAILSASFLFCAVSYLLRYDEAKALVLSLQFFGNWLLLGQASPGLALLYSLRHGPLELPAFAAITSARSRRTLILGFALLIPAAIAESFTPINRPPAP